MKTITLNYDEVTGNVTDRAGTYIGCASEVHDVLIETKASNIGDLIQLKEAGFTVDEILELRRKELI